MPITIENTGGDTNGTCHYLLQVGDNRIAHFKHHRPAGLAQCLKEAYKAAVAVERKDRAENLKKLRNELGLTMKQVSREAGISIGYLNDMEAGRKKIGKVGQAIETLLLRKQEQKRDGRLP